MTMASYRPRRDLLPLERDSAFRYFAQALSAAGADYKVRGGLVIDVEPAVVAKIAKSVMDDIEKVGARTRSAPARKQPAPTTDAPPAPADDPPVEKTKAPAKAAARKAPAKAAGKTTKTTKAATPARTRR